MKLTKEYIDSAQYRYDVPGKVDIRWDDSIPGFGVRIFPTGRKSFVMRYRAAGVTLYYTLGPYGVLTLYQARQLATIKKAAIIKGEDPAARRKKAGRSAKMKDFAPVFLKRHSQAKKKSWRDDASMIRHDVIPVLGGKFLCEIKRQDISRLHSKIGERGCHVRANRMLSLMSKMFECAKEWGYVDEDYPNPAKKIERFPELERDRWIKEDEMPRLAKAIAEEEDIFVRHLIWLYLLTGLRREELKNVRWSDIDFNKKHIRIERTKAGRPHYVPLSSAAIDILRSTPKYLGNPYVFCGAVPQQPLVNISKPWSRIRERAGLPDVRIHDLRRTLGSWLAMGGASLLMIGKILNHSNEKTTKVYARLQQEPMRELLEKHGEELSKFIVAGNDKPRA